jgi:hypothetical protein
MIDRTENLLPRLMPAGIEHHELQRMASGGLDSTTGAVASNRA